MKHYACNNQETNRNGIDVHIDERALREIYLPAFKAAVTEAKPWSMMSAYNLVNGEYCSQNSYLLTTILRKEWGWDGMMMSDWGAIHDTLGATMGGNDLEMPDGAMTSPQKLKPLIDAGKVPMAVIDEKVRRILRCLDRTGLLDGTAHKPDHSKVGGPQNRPLVRAAGEKSIVLLKNNHLLPLDPGVRSIAVIGTMAEHMPTTAGGSCYVEAVSSISPLEGIRAKFGGKAKVGYAEGYQLKASHSQEIPVSVLASGKGGKPGDGLLAEYFANDNFQGAPVLQQIETRINHAWKDQETPGEGIPHDNFTTRWTGTITAPKTGSYEFALTSDDGSRLYIDDKQVVDNWGGHPAQTKLATVELTAGKPVPIRVDYSQLGGEAEVALRWYYDGMDNGSDLALSAAVALAKVSDVAVICAGINSDFEGEEYVVRERADFSLPGTQLALIKAVAAVNPKTVVIIFNGGQVEFSTWIDHVPAVFEAFYPGQEGGAVLADLLAGTVNPSGYLPVTIGKRREDYGDYGLFPNNSTYREGIYVGYRWFDKKGIEPLFPFGYGLSYTTFDYSPAKASSATMPADGRTAVTVTVTNTGKMAGDEVVQLYVHDPAPKVDRPLRELRAFARVTLKPGESKPVTLTITPRDLSFCDVPHKQWLANAGSYEIQIGASSRDIRTTCTVTLAADWNEAIPGMP